MWYQKWRHLRHPIACVSIARLGTKNVIIIIIIIIMIILIYIAQFDTNGILTALYIVIQYIQMQYVHIRTYMKQSYSYTYTCLHINTYTVTCTNIYIYRHTNKFAYTHITYLPILLHLHVCLGIYI